MCAAAALFPAKPREIFTQIEQSLISLSTATHLISWATETLDSMNSDIGKNYLVSHITTWKNDATKAKDSIQTLIKAAEGVEMVACQYFCLQALSSYDRLPKNSLPKPVESQLTSSSIVHNILSPYMEAAVLSTRKIFETIIQNSLSAYMLCKPDVSHKDLDRAQKLSQESTKFLSDWNTDNKQQEGSEALTPDFDALETACADLCPEETSDALLLHTSMHKSIQDLIRQNHPPGLELSIDTLTKAIETLCLKPNFQVLDAGGLKNLESTTEIMFHHLYQKNKNSIQMLYQKITKNQLQSMGPVVNALKSLSHENQLSFVISCYHLLVPDHILCDTFLQEIFENADPSLDISGTSYDLLQQTKTIIPETSELNNLYGYKLLANNVQQLFQKPDRTINETALLLHCIAFYQRKEKECL